MKNKDFLFDLVHSLDKHEVKFISERAKTHRRKPEKVLALFRDLRNAREFKPKLLKSKYKSLDVLRFRLKKLIMESLRAMHAEESPENMIRRHLENERLLSDRGIYQEASRELEKARKLAETYHLIGLRIEIERRAQKRLIETQTKELSQAVEESIEGLGQLLEILNEEIHAGAEYHRRFAEFRTKEAPESTGEDNEPPKRESTIPHESSFSTKLYRILSDSFSARKVGDIPEARRTLKVAIELFEKHTDMLSIHQSRYKMMLANYAVHYFAEDNFDEVETIIAKFSELPDTTFNEEAETFQNVIHLKVLLALNRLDFSDIKELENDVSAGLKEYEAKINPARYLAVCFNMVLLWFAAEDFPSAHRWLQLVLENRKHQVRKEVHYAARLIELVIYLELPDWKHPDNSIAAVEQYLKRKEQLTEFKYEVIRAISRLTRTPLLEQQPVLRALLNTLTKRSLKS